MRTFSVHNHLMKDRFFLLLIVLFLLASFTHAQNPVSVSGMVQAKATQLPLSFANVLMKRSVDSVFVAGTISDEQGRFRFSGILPGRYFLDISLVGYLPKRQSIFIGNLSQFLELKPIDLESNATTLNEIIVSSQPSGVNDQMNKFTFNVSEGIAQAGGSVMQMMRNLPGVTIQDGKVMLRGNDKVVVLIDGKQTALTGFGNQTGLDNIPASALERIEIINNPSSKYDANGNAGIINLVYKKSKKDGFNGKLGMAGGLGALWEKKGNLPQIRPQYKATPKLNPSLSLNYRKNNTNLFFQGDYLYTETLNKNEFVDRNHGNGTIVRQQTKRNRNTAFTTLRSGIDQTIGANDVLSISGMFGTEKIIDRGDQPFFNAGLTQRLRLWQFLEDELKTTVMASLNYQHKFSEAGHQLVLGYNYTFHREDEKYFFDNFLPAYTSKDAFKLLSDEQVSDINLDYTKPLSSGRIETGIKFRYRSIPTNMQFFPGQYSAIDANAGGWANYRELIPAAYVNYVYETEKIETEFGLRAEYLDLQYEVNPNHNTYKTDGYHYLQPFPSLRMGYKVDGKNKLSFYYNRRVDRPNEVDIRIFPKYDDAEIIKVGNPGLRPQFTNTLEMGFRSTWPAGSFYGAVYQKMANGTITRISTVAPGKNLIYAVFQNAGKSYASGIDLQLAQKMRKRYSFDINLNLYQNTIDAFSVVNKYPVASVYSATLQRKFSWNMKVNQQLMFANGSALQMSMVYLAPDIIPQGEIGSRFSLDLGFKKPMMKGKGELFFNATDLLNTMNIRKNIQGNGFNYVSTDYYETQVVRVGMSLKW